MKKRYFVSDISEDILTDLLKLDEGESIYIKRD